MTSKHTKELTDGKKELTDGKSDGNTDTSGTNTPGPAIPPGDVGPQPPPKKPTPVPDRGGRGARRNAVPVVGVESVPPLTPTPTTEKPVRIRRTKSQIASDKVDAENAEREANAENNERLRKDTHATVAVFLKGFNPLFTHILPPPLDKDEVHALAHVWTQYMIQDGAEIPVGKAAVALSCIVVIPRVVLAIVDWFVKRRKESPES